MGAGQSLTAEEVAPPALEGLLQKRSDHLMAWRERYFRLEAGAHHLNYWCGEPPQHGPFSNAMARIAQDCGAMRSLGINWPVTPVF